MKCPKCNFDHPDQTTECLACGLIFAKYALHAEAAELLAPPVVMDEPVQAFAADDAQSARIAESGMLGASRCRLRQRGSCRPAPGWAMGRANKCVDADAAKDVAQVTPRNVLHNSSLIIKLLALGWTFQAPLSPAFFSGGEGWGEGAYNPSYYALINIDNGHYV
jgi:hypothetical protein